MAAERYLEVCVERRVALRAARLRAAQRGAASKLRLRRRGEVGHFGKVPRLELDVTVLAQGTGSAESLLVREALRALLQGDVPLAAVLLLAALAVLALGHAVELEAVQEFAALALHAQPTEPVVTHHSSRARVALVPVALEDRPPHVVRKAGPKLELGASPCQLNLVALAFIALLQHRLEVERWRIDRPQQPILGRRQQLRLLTRALRSSPRLRGTYLPPFLSRRSHCQ